MAWSSGWKGEQDGVGISGEVNGTIRVTVSLPVTLVECRLPVGVPVGSILPVPVPVPAPEVDRSLVLVSLGELIVWLVLVVLALLGMTSSLGMKLDEELPGPGPLPPFLTVKAFLTCKYKYISIQ
jgi:hypothetical protein